MTRRLVALDVLRGATVALMILVNNPGSWAHVLPPLRHAAWHGCTPTDLVFPFFLFSVGASLAFSFARRRAAGASRRDLARKVLTRSAVIFALGLLLNGFPYGIPLGGRAAAAFRPEALVTWLVDLRVMGVLQRIAVAYLLAGLAVVGATDTRRRLLIGGACLLAYELLMRLPLVDGWGAGSFARADSFARWLDLRLLGAPHMLAGEGGAFEPEGLVSSLTSAVTVLLGFAAGERLRAGDDPRRALRPLTAASLLVAAGGLVLAPLEPVNKQLWTASYTLLTAGLAGLCLAGCVWLVDVAGRRRWVQPAVVFGANPLVAFLGSGLLARLLALVRVPVPGGGEASLRHLAMTRVLVPWAGAGGASLLYAALNVLVWLGVLAWLHRRGWYVRV